MNGSTATDGLSGSGSTADLDRINAQLREQVAEVARECRPNVIRAKFANETDFRYLAYERIALRSQAADFFGARACRRSENDL